MSPAGNEDAWGPGSAGRRRHRQERRNSEIPGGFSLCLLYKLQQFSGDWRFRLDNFFDAKYFGWWDENLEKCTIC
jgi:hypothetical protein